MSKTRTLSEPKARANFIGDFEPVKLIDFDEGSSAKGNKYAVYVTENNDRVGIMDGELEALHVKESGVFVDENDKDIPQDATLKNMKGALKDGILIGRVEGQLIKRN